MATYSIKVLENEEFAEVTISTRVGDKMVVLPLDDALELMNAMSVKTKQITYDNVIYNVIPERKSISCNGCHLYSTEERGCIATDNLCMKCNNERVIYVRAE